MDDNPNKDQPVTITAPPAAAVTIDPQNPLPEPSFFWRRLIACGITIFALVMAWRTAGQLYEMRDAGRLYDLTRLVLMGAGLAVTYYFVAPSAAELTSMIQTARIQRQAVSAAISASKNAIPGAGAGQAERFAPPASPDSQIPVAAPGEAPRPPSDDLEIDAAPRSRT